VTKANNPSGYGHSILFLWTMPERRLKCSLQGILKVAANSLYSHWMRRKNGRQLESQRPPFINQNYSKTPSHQCPTTTGELVAGGMVVAGATSVAVTVKVPSVPHSRLLAPVNDAVPLTIARLFGRKAVPSEQVN
jgi:hypothetical protein